MKRLAITVVTFFLLVCAAPAQNFSEATPGGPYPQAIGGPVGSQTFVLPQQSGSVVSISPAFAKWMQPYIDAATNALILALVGWVCSWMRTHWNIQIDEKHRDAITTALQNQAGSLIADGVVKVSNGKIDVHSEALAAAAKEVMAVVPQAAKRFGITPDFVAARIIDTIPQIEAGAQMLAKDVRLP